MIPSSPRNAKVLVSLSVVPHVLEVIKVNQVNNFQIERALLILLQVGGFESCQIFKQAI